MTARLDDPELQALFAAVVAAPADPVPKLALADWCDERGRPWVAHAFAWCANRGKHPWVINRSAAWFPLSRQIRRPERYPDCLPQGVFDLLQPKHRFGNVPACRYRSRTPTASQFVAFLALADAFQRIRELTDR